MCTGGENIIGVPKMRNHFLVYCQIVNFFNIAITIFFIAPWNGIALNLLCFLFGIFYAAFFDCSLYSYFSSNYHKTKYFSLLEAISKSFALLFAIAFKNTKDLQLLLWQYLEKRFLYGEQWRKEAMNLNTKPIQKMKQSWKSNNYMGSNRKI